MVEITDEVFFLLGFQSSREAFCLHMQMIVYSSKIPLTS